MWHKLQTLLKVFMTADNFLMSGINPALNIQTGPTYLQKH